MKTLIASLTSSPDGNFPVVAKSKFFNLKDDLYKLQVVAESEIPAGQLKVRHSLSLSPSSTH